jgi:hypothetical protein
MQQFTGAQYLKIDIANQFGMDKDLFEDRIAWVDQNEHQLESLMDQADESPIQYIKAVESFRRAQLREPIGHIVHFDACASGLQIMGVLSGCVETCRNTGLINPNVRADIYTTAHGVMNTMIGGGVEVIRSAIKSALMTHFYGSWLEPVNTFGEGEELKTFYKTAETVAPGASYLRDILMETWQSNALHHSWALPDGFHAYVPVMNTIDMKIKVDELQGAQFTHRIKVNEAKERGVSNTANPIHSIDGMVVREMNRRCNYNREELEFARDTLIMLGADPVRGKSKKFISLRYATDWLGEVTTMSQEDMDHVLYLVEDALNNKSFPIACVHDAFGAHANNVNRVRQVYLDILVELSYTETLEDIIEEITGTRPKLIKGHPDIGSLIQHANYHLS